MSQSISLWGANYSDVPYVDLPKTGSGTARFMDTTDADATAPDIVSGKTAYVNNVKVVGTGSGGGGSPNLQTKSKSYTPSETAQSETVTYDSGYDGLDEVSISVGAISSTYVGSGITQRDSSDLSASGATVTAPSGYYASSATKTISSGSATPASSISATGASVTTGTNTLTLSKSSVANTPQVSAGYISSGTQGNSSVSLSATVTTKGATTYYPGTSNQTINASQYLTGIQTINAVSQTNLSAENIKSGTTISISNGNGNIWSVTGSYTGGGGASNWVLLGTKSLGAISTSSTTDTDTGQTIVVTGWNDYDLIVCECSVNTETNNRHACSTRLAWLTASSSIGTKNGCTFATATWNCKLSSSGTATSRSNTTPYGVYAKAGTISGSNLTITIYQRYNSTQTGTINGSYTMRIYGVKIYDLIGG